MFVQRAPCRGAHAGGGLSTGQGQAGGGTDTDTEQAAFFAEVHHFVRNVHQYMMQRVRESERERARERLPHTAP